MGFLSNKDDESDTWKEKYLRLLDTQEQAEKDYQVNEELLCKTIVRFALAVKGLNKELDPHLSRIRNLLKAGLKSQQLRLELEDFSRALMQLEEAPTSLQSDASVLFDFLNKQHPKLKSELQILEQRYQRGELNNSAQLFPAIVDLTSKNSSSPAVAASVMPAIESKEVNHHLLRLLDSIEVPGEYAEKAEMLRAGLDSDKPLLPLIDDTIDLLLALKRHFDQQQQEMASFLSKLTEQLAELGLKATGVNIANEKAIKKRNLLDQTVSEQMDDLQKKSADATQLEPLKQLINTRLQSISQQIQAHNQQERVEREKVQQELNALSEKIQHMEVESGELKTKLAAAQHKATRDPLTGLPNRLAFDEHLAAEVARWKRYQVPLSMAVWDIDFFKRINDSYGHKSGDKALVIIAKLLTEHCRETDFVARFGGEEFVMLLPDSDINAALVVTNKIREMVEKSSFNANGERIKITLSCGIAQFSAGDSSEGVFERADKALYQAKQNGRNQCVAN